MTNNRSERLGFTLDWKPVLVFVSIAACLVLWFGSEGVRGTDQYWYLGDVETLAEHKPPLTNIVYPGKLLRESAGEVSPNYFMHNGPFIAVAAFIGKFFSPYSGWMLLNFVSHFVVAGTIFFVCRIYTTASIAGWVTALYLVSPIAIWQSLNMLQEQIYAGCLAVCLAGFAYRSKWQWQVVLVAALAIGTLSHPLFFLLANFYLFYCAVTLMKAPSYLRGSGIVLVGIVIYAAQYFKGVIFPSSFQPDMQSIVAGAVPGVSNMLWHQSDRLEPVSISLLLDKLSFALRAHFLQPRNWPLYLYTNIAIVAGFYLFFFRLRVYRELLFAACLCLGAYVGLLVLMQTQVRYQQIVAAATFVVIGLAIYDLRHLVKPWQAKALGVMLLTLNIGIAAVMAIKARKEARAEAADLAYVMDSVSDIAIDKRMLLLDLNLEPELRLSYAFRPRQTLIVKREFLSDNSAQTAVSKFAPDFLVTDDPDESIPFAQGAVLSEIKTRTMGNFFIFSMK